MRNVVLAEGEHYHVFNRGVDRRAVFETDSQFQRFYENLYLFNDVSYARRGMTELQRTTLLASALAFEHEREPLVDIVAFILMPNHFHLNLVQRAEQGISRFLHKLEMGYSKFFNIRSERSGNLFNHSFGSRHIDTEAYFAHVPRYIHLNALDLTPLDWRAGKLSQQDWLLAKDFLDTYRWSSHSAYARREQLLPIVSTEWIHDLFANPELYDVFLREWSGRYKFDSLSESNQTLLTK